MGEAVVGSAALDRGPPEPADACWEATGAPVSFVQERMWFTELLQPGLRAYVEPRAIRLDGPLSAAALRDALADVTRDHALLRCCFREVDGTPTLWVRRHVDVPLQVLDASRRREAELVREEMERGSGHRFDLATGPLWHGRLLRLAADRHLLVLVFHHMVFDTVSARCFARQLADAYDARLRGGRSAPRPGSAPAYLAYARAQRATAAEAAVQSAVRHWAERLTPLPEPLDLPTDRPRPETPSGHGDSLFLPLGTARTSRLKQASAAARSTSSIFLATAFALTLRAVSGQSQLTIGTTVSDRPAEHQQAIGPCLNTLVLCFDLDGATTFAEALTRVRGTLLEAHEHALAPFGEVVRRVNPPRDAGRNPLFQASIDFDVDPLFDLRLPGVEATELQVAPQRAPFDLTLFVRSGADAITCQIEYASPLFERTTIEQLATGFEAVVDAALEDRHCVPDAALADAADADARLARFERARPLARPSSPSIVERMQEHARVAPARTAVEAPDGAPIGFGVLLERATTLAELLAGCGVAPGSAAMLALPQQPSLAVAMIGVLLAGGAYVPVDLRHPPRRKTLVAADCAPAALVCAAGDAAPWWPGGPRIELDDHGVAAERASAAVHAVRGDVPGGMPGYMLYTSGSTGRPKGVVMPRAGLENLARWHSEVHRPARTLQYASPGFDVCTQEVVCTLATGGTVVMIPPEVRLDPAALADVLRERRIEQMHTPATPLRLVLETLGERSLPDLRTLVVGGEPLLLTERLQAFMRRHPHTSVWNEYGPTETHAVTRHRVGLDDERRVPIGTPVPNVVVRLLAPYTPRRVPRGAVGEICVAGSQVASGYRRTDAPGSARFVADPHAARSGARMYRTGDLGRWRGDGVLRFLGRVDDQIKVRGNRVEPGEVQAVLQSLPLVADVAVLPGEDRQGDPTLCAYVVPASTARGLDGRALLATLREHLLRQLPDYMVPGAWTILAELPVNASGKVDRGALPRPEFADSSATSDPPADAVEAAVHEIWCAELALDEVGATTSFFAVGGHSLNAVAVVSRVSERFGVACTLTDFFRSPTIRATAATVQRLIADR